MQLKRLPKETEFIPSWKIRTGDPALGFYLEGSTGTVICQYAAYSTSDPNPPRKFVKGEKYALKLDFSEKDTTNFH